MTYEEQTFISHSLGDKGAAELDSGKSPFVGCGPQMPHYLHTEETEHEFSGVSFITTLIPFSRAPLIAR